MSVFWTPFELCAFICVALQLRSMQDIVKQPESACQNTLDREYSNQILKYIKDSCTDAPYK